ncbi:MAG: hypothetical protein JWQ71_3541 [Pedosphaera sp.]|nr:hypothetical protein [Pedosphaera sp.]
MSKIKKNPSEWEVVLCGKFGKVFGHETERTGSGDGVDGLFGRGQDDVA